MSHIYSKEHQRLLKMPVMKFPSMTDEKYDLEIAYDMDAIDKDLEAYNNWLNDDKINPPIPPEYQEHFSKTYKDGEIVPESEFEIKVALQNVLDKDDIITWCVGSLMIEGQWKKIYVALPIIKEEQSKDDNVVSGEEAHSSLSEYSEPIHEWFELSYAQYLTIPRSVLQSMPLEWQRKFVDCLIELDESMDWRPKEGRYWVSLKDVKGKYLHDPLMDYDRGRRRIPLNDGSFALTAFQSFFSENSQMLNSDKNVQVSDTTEAP